MVLSKYLTWVCRQWTDFRQRSGPSLDLLSRSTLNLLWHFTLSLILAALPGLSISKQQSFSSA